MGTKKETAILSQNPHAQTEGSRFSLLSPVPSQTTGLETCGRPCGLIGRANYHRLGNGQGHLRRLSQNAGANRAGAGQGKGSHGKRPRSPRTFGLCLLGKFGRLNLGKGDKRGRLSYETR